MKCFTVPSGVPVHSSTGAIAVQGSSGRWAVEGGVLGGLSSWHWAHWQIGDTAMYDVWMLVGGMLVGAALAVVGRTLGARGPGRVGLSKAAVGFIVFAALAGGLTGWLIPAETPLAASLRIHQFAVVPAGFAALLWLPTVLARTMGLWSWPLYLVAWISVPIFVQFGFKSWWWLHMM